jgi:hypothetical protein
MVSKLKFLVHPFSAKASVQSTLLSSADEQPLSLIFMMLHFTGEAMRSWIRIRFRNPFGQVRRVHLLLKIFLKGSCFYCCHPGELHLISMYLYTLEDCRYLISHPIVMPIPSPPGNPGGNSASAGFAHCRRSQRVPHLDRAWTHQISFFNCPLVF